MAEIPINERKQLEEAIAIQESLRGTIPDSVIDATITALREKLAAMAGATAPTAPTPKFTGERKLVTIMFADISGFTAFADKMDPESVRDVMNACFERLVPVVGKYGGTVDKYIGDEIMALFGAPTAHEDDPERALRAALEMMEELKEFNEEWGTYLGIHFGINTGLVIAGGIGTDQRQEYSVMGDVVNLAARLGDVSESGEIIVGLDTYTPTVPLFDYETRGPIRVKGTVEPVPVFRLIGAKSRPGQVRGLERRGISSPLVGRETEIRTLEERIKELMDGQGGIISIIGEAGVGKSRLMAELQKAVDMSDLTWLEGRARSFGRTMSFLPFQEILWQYAGITEEDIEAEAWAKLESRIRALFPENTAKILPYLASLLALEVREAYIERVKHLDGEAMGRQVFLTSRRFFERLAKSHPLVLLFEDLHWADESSASLLEHLLPLVERAPLLIIGVSRPHHGTPATRFQEIAGQDFSGCYNEIQLTTLSHEKSNQLIHNLLEIENLPSNAQEMILQKAEGNPFFLEEIIRVLIDTGAVRRDPSTGRWQATAHIQTITVPDTIQGVILARVDRLDENVQQLLQNAAVIGRSFFYRVLCTITEMEEILDEHLNELQAIELIREKQRLPELEYIFKHALAQEAIYESILVQKRRKLHARVGQAIEKLFKGRLEEYYGLLAYHYARGEAWDKAHEYLLKAADQAGRIAADAEALAHYRQAMVAYAHAFGDQWAPLERAKLESKMGEALFRRGEHQQAIEYLQRALNYLGKPLPKSRWGMWLAILHETSRQVGHRLLPRLFLKSAGVPASPAVEEEFRLYEAIGWIDVFAAYPERLILTILKGLNVSERNGFSYGATAGSSTLGFGIDTIPIFWLAEGYHRRAVALAKQNQDPRAAGYAYLLLGMHKSFVGEGVAAIKCLRRAMKEFWEVGDLRRGGLPAYHLVLELSYRGSFSQALKVCQNLVRVGEEGADRQVQCWGLAGQGFVQQRLGQFDDGITALQEAIQLARAVSDQAFLISANADLGRCHLRRGNLDLALTALQASQEFYAENMGQDSYASLRNGLSDAFLLVVGQSDNTDRAYWLNKARHACRDALKLGKAYRPCMPEAMRLQGIYEWLRGKPGVANKWWQRSLVLATELDMPYDLGLVHLEMGQREGELIHLESAEVIFADIGAEWDLGKTQDVLREL